MVKYFYFLMLSFLLLGISCKKSGDANNPVLEQLFESNILNRDFTVSLATDNGTDLTANYAGYTFQLSKTDFYHGPLQAKKNGTTFTGTWSSNSDYSQLIITLPNPPSEFSFLSRSWRFTSKNFPTLALAPWGSNDPIVLHMYRN
jgi:hypothetical protein